MKTWNLKFLETAEPVKLVTRLFTFNTHLNTVRSFIYFCATCFGSSIPSSSDRNTSTYSESMLCKWVMMCGSNHPKFLQVAGLHAVALITINPSTSRCRLCTTRFNVKSCANWQPCRAAHVDQKKQWLFLRTRTACLYLTMNPRTQASFLSTFRNRDTNAC
jgi:hypothetical protein